MKHTPGPWCLMNSHKAGFVDVYATHQTGSAVDSIATDFICEIGPGARREGDLNAANAQLIAAAPEMLEELKRLLWNIDKRDLTIEDFDSVSAVIAKAEGKAP